MEEKGLKEGRTGTKQVPNILGHQITPKIGVVQAQKAEMALKVPSPEHTAHPCAKL